MRVRFLPVVLVACCATVATAGFKDGVFTSAEHGARFKLPKGATVDTSNTSEGKVVLFQSEDGELRGVLRHVKEGMGAAKHAKWRGAEWEKKGALVTWESEEKVAGKEGDWVKVVLELEAGEDEMKSAHLFVSRGKDDFELAVMSKAGDWEKSVKVADEILASLEFGEFKEEEGEPGPKVEEPEAKGGGLVWADAARGIAIRGAAGWTWRTEDFHVKDPYEILEWATGNEEFIVTLSEVDNPSGTDAKTWADMTVKALGKSFKNQQMLEGKAPAGTERRDFTAENMGKSMRFVFVFFGRNEKIYYLQVICLEEAWDEVKDSVKGVVGGLVLGDVSAQEKEMKEQGATGTKPPAGGGGPGEGKEVLLPNPWEGCGKGSWAKYRMVTEAAGTKTEMEMTTTLVNFDEESYTIKTDMVMGGNAIPGQETKINLRQKAAGGEAPKSEEGDEKVKVAKGEMACHWVKTTTDQGWSQSWTSAEVPGRTVKILAEYAGSKTEMELLDCEKK